MTGVCSPSMPVWVVEDGSRRAFSTLERGRRADAVVRRRRRRGRRAAALLPRRPRAAAGADARAPRADRRLRARRAGPEHGRRAAHAQPGDRQPAACATCSPAIAVVGGEAAARFIAGNHHFFLNLTMAAAKCASLALDDCARLERGLADLAQRRRRRRPARGHAGPLVHRRRPRRSATRCCARATRRTDAARDIGDSAVIECIGPRRDGAGRGAGVAAFFGGDAAAAAARTELMAQICAARSERFTISARDGIGTPVGIDARMVVELDVTPQITTGVLHASRARARSAPASPTSRSSRSAPRSPLSLGARRDVSGRVSTVQLAPILRAPRRSWAWPCGWRAARWRGRSRDGRVRAAPGRLRAPRRRVAAGRDPARARAAR